MRISDWSSDVGSSDLPETMPLAMPSPKMPRPTSDNAASTIAIASSMVGVAPPKPNVNSEKSVEPMPMMTPSTSTLMPDEMTLPSTRSAMNADLPNRPNEIGRAHV